MTPAGSVFERCGHASDAALHALSASLWEPAECVTFGSPRRALFGGDSSDQDQIGYIDANTRAIFGHSYAAEPDVLVQELARDEAIAAVDTLLLTVPNQLGVDHNAQVLKSILEYVAPELGWR